MDPHSTRSQFNRREPKAGPLSRTTPEKIYTQDTVKMPPMKKAKTDETSPLVRRPIATNSRIKQDEMVRRDMYLSFITNAFQQKSNGDSKSFDELVAQFNLFSTTPTVSKMSSKKQNQLPIDVAEIRLWFAALSHVVSRLEITHAALVDAIVNLPWMTLDIATVKAYTLFIGMLLSARPEYLSLVLAKIAIGFTYQSGMQALGPSMPSTSKTPLRRRAVYERIHYLLRHLLSLIPTLPSTLQPLLVRHFPHKRQNQVAQTTYIRNLLHLSSYCPELSDKILGTIVDRAIQIDVEIQIELEDLEDSEGIEDSDVFDLDLDPFDAVVGEDPASDSGSESSEDDNDAFSDLSSDAGDLDDESSDIQTSLTHIHNMVKKLDAILILLFKHFEDTVNSVGVRKLIGSGHIPVKLPPLPALELPTSGGLTSPFSQILPPYTSSAGSDPSIISFPPTPPLSIPRPRLPNNNERSKAALRTQFNTLLSIFDRTILRTFKSRYTQFLIFWYTSVDPEFADIFQGLLVERALIPGANPTVFVRKSLEDDISEYESFTNAHLLTPEVTRAAAASYIGSFVSRATFVDREGTRRVVSVLCEFLKAHLEGVEQAVQGRLIAFDLFSIVASGQHLVFYSVTQAVFLIFCFRWRDLMVDGVEDEDELGSNVLKTPGSNPRWTSTGSGKDIWLPELSVLRRVVSSVLNPLKVCSFNVVNQFARIAHSTNFLYCYTILDGNRRSDVGDSSSPRAPDRNSTVFCRAGNTAELNTFFPFDPCRLPQSNNFIQDVYREWESVKIQGDDDDDDDDEEKDDEDKEGRGGEDMNMIEKGTYCAIPTKASNSDEERLGESLGAMSISPAMVMKSVSG